MDFCSVLPESGSKFVHAERRKASASAGSSARTEYGVQIFAAVRDAAAPLARIGRRAVTGLACMMSGGTVHAAVASNWGRANRVCPKTILLASGNPGAPRQIRKAGQVAFASLTDWPFCIDSQFWGGTTPERGMPGSVLMG